MNTIEKIAQEIIADKVMNSIFREQILRYANNLLRELELARTDLTGPINDFKKNISNLFGTEDYSRFENYFPNLYKYCKENREDLLKMKPEKSPVLEALQKDITKLRFLLTADRKDRAQESYGKILELLRSESKKLNDDETFELHELLKKFFNKIWS